jgi:hypothetical protein
MTKVSTPTPHEEKPQPAVETKANPFDPNRFRISQDYGATAMVKKATTVIKVGKPDKTQFIRVNPDPEYQMTVFLYELEEEREIYLVVPDVAMEMGEGVAVRKTLFTTRNRAGVTFLWPVKLPNSEGKLDLWNRSAMEGAQFAQTKYVSIRSNRAAGYYDTFEAVVALPEPDWSDLPTPAKMLEAAFRGHVIEDTDHPIVRVLQGLA